MVIVLLKNVFPLFSRFSYVIFSKNSSGNIPLYVVFQLSAWTFAIPGISSFIALLICISSFLPVYSSLYQFPSLKIQIKRVASLHSFLTIIYFPLQLKQHDLSLLVSYITQLYINLLELK